MKRITVYEKEVNEYDENGNSLDFGFGFRRLYIF